MRPVLVLGKTGQLGSAFKKLLGADAHVAGVADVDFSRADFLSMLDTFTAGREYAAVINAAAYTQVDKAEGEGKELAWRINAEAVGELAGWCAKRGLPLVHYSTDYVYAGTGSGYRDEKEPPAPPNNYGRSKLEGDRLVEISGARHLIFRTSWVYDAHGKNFFNTMLRLFSEKDSLSVVSDQIGAPTYAPHLAAASWQGLKQALSMPVFPSGIYHLASSGETSWYGFAQAIFALATGGVSGQKSSVRCASIRPILTSDYPLPAKRPLNSRLDCSKAKEVLGVALPDWNIGLKECFAEKYENTDLRDTRPQNHPAQSAG